MHGRDGRIRKGELTCREKRCKVRNVHYIQEGPRQVDRHSNTKFLREDLRDPSIPGLRASHQAKSGRASGKCIGIPKQRKPRGGVGPRRCGRKRQACLEEKSRPRRRGACWDGDASV